MSAADQRTFNRNLKPPRRLRMLPSLSRRNQTDDLGFRWRPDRLFATTMTCGCGRCSYYLPRFFLLFSACVNRRVSIKERVAILIRHLLRPAKGSNMTLTVVVELGESFVGVFLGLL